MWTQHGNFVNSLIAAAFKPVCFGWTLAPSYLDAGRTDKTGTHEKTPVPLPITEKVISFAGLK